MEVNFAFPKDGCMIYFSKNNLIATSIDSKEIPSLLITTKFHYFQKYFNSYKLLQ